jgi:hypothetical protein
MAGILTLQTNAMFRRNPDGTTYFILCLSNTEKDQFVAYYNDNFPGFIINVEITDNGSVKLTVNTQYLFDTIAPALGNYLQASMGAKNNQGTKQEICRIV